MAMGHLMEGDGPDDYAQLRRDLAALVTSPHVGFTRPQPKDRTAGKGKRLVRGADAMVPVPDDKLRHLTDAMHTHALPGKGPAACLQADCAYHLTPAAEQAIKDMLEVKSRLNADFNTNPDTDPNTDPNADHHTNPNTDPYRS